MAAWDPFDQNAAAPFFDPEWMFGSPPRFDLSSAIRLMCGRRRSRIRSPRWKSTLAARTSKGNPLGAYSGTADLFVYFIQRGIELLNPGGAFAFITSNKWYRAKYGRTCVAG